jgi:preprotein translocase subunit SecD
MKGIVWIGIGLAATLLLVVVGVVALGALGFFEPRPEPVGTVLTYRLDGMFQGDAAAEAAMVAEVFNRRLEGKPPLGRALVKDQAGDAPLVAVEVYGTDGPRLAAVKRRLAALGTLEFRILANRRDHPEMIDKAQLDMATEVAHGKVFRTRWVPLALDQHGQPVTGFIDDPNLAIRDVKGGGPEVLAVIDPFNVTGADLTNVRASYDAAGRPSIDFRLNSQGARRLTALTSENLPDPITGFSRRMAVILNGVAHMAPSIQSTIGGEGEITGDFTLDEVLDAAAVLDSGALRGPVTLIEERNVEASSANQQAGH